MSQDEKVSAVHGATHEFEAHNDDESEFSAKFGTRDDKQSMWRMGKTQELLRNFRFVSIFGFSMILMASWETMLGYVYLINQ